MSSSQLKKMSNLYSIAIFKQSSGCYFFNIGFFNIHNTIETVVIFFILIDCCANFTDRKVRSVKFDIL